MRLRDLGVIAEATLPIGPGFTAITGETGAGKTMVVTGLGLLLGQRADSGAVRSGAAQASVDGVWIVPEARRRSPTACARPAVTSSRSATDRRSCSSGARSRARAAAARRSAGARRRPACSPTSPTSSSSCTASPTSCGCARRPRSAMRSTASAATAVQSALDDLPRAFERWRAIDARARRRSPTDRDARAARGRTAARRRSPRSSRPRRSRARTPTSRRAPSGSRTPKSCALAAATAHDAPLGRRRRARCRHRCSPRARRALERAARPGARRARRAGRRPRLPHRRSRRSRSRATSPTSTRPDPTSSRRSKSAARCSAALVRTHGTLDAAIALLETGSARLAELDDDGDRIERLTRGARCRGIRPRFRCRRPDGRANGSGRSGWAPRSRRSCARSRCPTRGVVVAVTPGAESATRPRRRRDPARPAHRRRTAARRRERVGRRAQPRHARDRGRDRRGRSGSDVRVRRSRRRHRRRRGDRGRPAARAPGRGVPGHRGHPSRAGRGVREQPPVGREGERRVGHGIGCAAARGRRARGRDGAAAVGTDRLGCRAHPRPRAAGPSGRSSD